MPSESPEILGRYAVYGALASGGMATVHLGRLVGPVGFSRTVAIKRMRSDLLADPDFVSMFIDEARVAGRISHPNVVAVHDVVATERELLLVMEYVHGETLGRLMQLAEKRGGIPPAIGAAIMRDVLAGLHAAHETRDENGAALGIVHRDVSPQNILVGIDGVARVLDFGVAKAIGGSHVTREGELKGKLAYMAPEQLQGRATRSSDVFAASVIFWEILCHDRLFRGETDAETVGKVLTLVVTPPSTVNPELATALDQVVLRGLERASEARFPTARDMTVALAKAGEIADAAAVGEWVSEIAKSRLTERESIVSAVERGVVSDAAPLSRPSSSLPSVALPSTPVLLAAEPFDTRFDAATVIGAAPKGVRWAKVSTAVAFVALAALAVALVTRTPRDTTAPAAAPPPAATALPQGAVAGTATVLVPAPSAAPPVALSTASATASSTPTPVVAQVVASAAAPPATRPASPRSGALKGAPPATPRATPAIPDRL